MWLVATILDRTDLRGFIGFRKAKWGDYINK